MRVGILDWMNKLVDLQRGKHTTNTPATNRRLVTISAASPSTGTASITYPDTTVVAGVSYGGSYAPAVGDKAVVLDQAGDVVIIDAIANPAGSGLTGMIGHTRATSAPSGWLIRNGGSIPAAHTALIALVGSTTPDDRDKFIAGSGTTYTNGTAYNFGTTGSNYSLRGYLPIIHV